MNKVTMNDILEKMKQVEYIKLSDGRTTLCVVYTENGYTIIGKSACVAEENYNQALGEKYAFEDAVNQMWPLEGYLLKQKLYEEAK